MAGVTRAVFGAVLLVFGLSLVFTAETPTIGLFFALVGLVLLVWGVSARWYTGGRRPPEPIPPDLAPVPGPSSPPDPSATPGEATASACDNCGRTSARTAAFCQWCGAPLRSLSGGVTP